MTGLILFLSAAFAAAPPPSYAEGQVWQYKTRPQDSGSLVKIQRIEKLDDETVYHVSIVGIRISGDSPTDLPHAPVWKDTLDVSVVAQTKDPGTFPDPAEGIEEWRNAKGGIFSISLAEIAEILAESLPPSAND